MLELRLMIEEEYAKHTYGMAEPERILMPKCAAEGEGSKRTKASRTVHAESLARSFNCIAIAYKVKVTSPAASH